MLRIISKVQVLGEDLDNMEGLASRAYRGFVPRFAGVTGATCDLSRSYTEGQPYVYSYSVSRPRRAHGFCHTVTVFGAQDRESRLLEKFPYDLPAATTQKRTFEPLDAPQAHAIPGCRFLRVVPGACGGPPWDSATDRLHHPAAAGRIRPPVVALT